MISTEFVLRETETNREVIVAELKRLLRDEHFCSAPQMSSFLRYVVTETLNGNGNRIKAYTVGVDALGKPDAFDAQNDPSVRVLALRVRKALKSIYESDQPCEAFIELRLGSYAPEFYQAVSQQPTFGHVHGEAVSGHSSQPVREATAPSMAQGVNRQALRSDVDARGVSDKQRPATDFGVGVLEWLRADRVNAAYVMLALMSLLYIASLQLVNANASKGHNMLLGSIEQQKMQSVHPSVVLVSSDSQSEHLETVKTLIRASLLESGDLSVATGHRLQQPQQFNKTDYVIVFSESSVDLHPRVHAQILRADTGVVLMNEVFQLDTETNRLSTADVAMIDAFSHSVVDPAGPLKVDFCGYAVHVESGSCDTGLDNARMDNV